MTGKRRVGHGEPCPWIYYYLSEISTNTPKVDFGCRKAIFDLPSPICRGYSEIVVLDPESISVIRFSATVDPQRFFTIMHPIKEEVPLKRIILHKFIFCGLLLMKGNIRHAALNSLWGEPTTRAQGWGADPRSCEFQIPDPGRVLP